MVMFTLRLVITEHLDVRAEAIAAAGRAAEAMGKRTTVEINRFLLGKGWKGVPTWEQDNTVGMVSEAEVSVPTNSVYHWVDDGTQPVNLYKPLSEGGMRFRYTGTPGVGVNYAPKTDGRAGEGDYRGQIGPMRRVARVSGRYITARNITEQVVTDKESVILQAGQDAI